MDEEEEQLSRRRGILMRTQHVIALSGPPILAAAFIVCSARESVTMQHFFSSFSARPQFLWPSKLTQNPAREESSLSRAHKKPQLLDLCPKKGS